ncbi:hypothetical protein CSAL01_04129 [Colletotrichum salicis]|uniref:Uncharacterized protein n=1 Tax=Colletotrichum salicis TaxID=1209931 RepID=A0A135UT83_9PEZI|nr:hypothetical protein CSAL01_04129 [Colletotrichum salicis]
MRLCNRSGGRPQMSGGIPSQYVLRALCTSRLSPLASDIDFCGTTNTYLIVLPLPCAFARRVLDRVTDRHPRHLGSNKSVGPDLPRETTDQMKPCAHHADRTRYSYVAAPTIIDNNSVSKYLRIPHVLIHQPSSMGQGTPHPHPRSKGPDQTLTPVRSCDSVTQDQDLDMGCCPHGVFTSFL